MTEIQKKINDPASSQAISEKMKVPVDNMKAEVTKENPVIPTDPADPNNNFTSYFWYIIFTGVVLAIIIISSAV